VASTVLLKLLSTATAAMTPRSEKPTGKATTLFSASAADRGWLCSRRSN